MSISKEGLYSSIVARLRDTPVYNEENLTQAEQDHLFSMRCNGYSLLEEGRWWTFHSEILRPLVEEFKGQNVSFFGPDSRELFYSDKKIDHTHFLDPLAQPLVIAAIRKYREIDEDQAARIAFILGGIVRHLESRAPDIDIASRIACAVEFAARLTRLGDKRSGDAIASAAAMYIISDGSIDEDTLFTGNVYHMAEAVSEDPVIPKETRDLGLSQTLRLRAFAYKTKREKLSPPPDVSKLETDFSAFPTVGAEFHFPPNTPYKYPSFWQKLAILNMSQYQRGSYVQLSRNDRGVIEVRMNPSVYPVTIANWTRLRAFLPELNKAFFTITINRSTEQNFQWDNGDAPLLDNLRALGLLSYAGLFDSRPYTSEEGEIGFGDVYLGQTVKMLGGKYEFSGLWAGEEGQHGQMAIYTGFGENFPHLTYYLSLVLQNPDILKSIPDGLLSRVRTLEDALNVEPSEGRKVFTAIQNYVAADEKLNRVYATGNEIIKSLNP